MMVRPPSSSPPPPRLKWITVSSSLSSSSQLYSTQSDHNQNDNHNSNVPNFDDNDKFGWSQRWASVQSLVLGAVVGSLSSIPISLVHNFLILTIDNPWAQWEYDVDTNAIMGGLFAIVYRYCIRTDGHINPQLKQGCISAMILIRTLPQIHIPEYCTAFPLNCHHDNILSRLLFPMSYIFDDGIVLQQLFWAGLESTIVFTVTAQMMDKAMTQKYISQFPG